MANEESKAGKAGKSSVKATESEKRDHTFGRGMTSPDSTQAALSAETGEPDPATLGGTSGRSASPGDRDAARSRTPNE